MSFTNSSPSSILARGSIRRGCLSAHESTFYRSAKTNTEPQSNHNCPSCNHILSGNLKTATCFKRVHHSTPPSQLKSGDSLRVQPSDILHVPTVPKITIGGREPSDHVAEFVHLAVDAVGMGHVLSTWAQGNASTACWIIATTNHPPISTQFQKLNHV